MVTEIELEKTYLLQGIPEEVETLGNVYIKTIFIPEDDKNAVLRLRQKGDEYTITKKVRIDKDDPSARYEHTINLSKEEFEALESCSGTAFFKQRYFVKCAGRNAELDVYKGDLEGLVVIDFEFENKEEMDSFTRPDFALADVTGDLTFTGGNLMNKTFADILPDLTKYGLR